MYDIIMDINNYDEAYNHLASNPAWNKIKEECERTISKSPYHSYCYAYNILDGRFELGETAIATNSQYSYIYARDVLNQRFILGEASIIKIPTTIAKYARDVICGPWREAEQYLNGDQLATFIYLISVPNSYSEVLLNTLNESYKISYKTWFLREL